MKVHTIGTEFVNEVNYLEDRLHDDVCNECDCRRCDGEFTSSRCEWWGRHDNISASCDVIRAFLRLV